MFVIVDLSDERKRRFEKYRKHIFETKRCDVMGSAPFFIAKGHRQYFDFAELEKIIKRCGTAIFKDGYIPDGMEKYSFVPSVLPLRMLVNTAVEYFRENPSAGRNITVSIVDEFAFAVKEVTALSQYVRFVRVITKRQDLYSFAELDAYSSFGVVLLTGKSDCIARGSNLLISLNDGNFNPQDVENALVYSKNTYCENVYSVKKVLLFLQNLKKRCAEQTIFVSFVLYSKPAGIKSKKFPFSVMQNQYFIKHLLDFFIKFIYNILSLFPHSGTVLKNADYKAVERKKEIKWHRKYYLPKMLMRKSTLSLKSSKQPEEI